MLLWLCSGMPRPLGFAIFSMLLVGVLASPAAAQGTLSLKYTTQSHNGPYAPDHVVAVWVEGPDGTFVKTIDRWASARVEALVAWRQKSGTTDTDAVSGATLISHTQPLSKTWDLRDRQGQEIPDGTYTIRMELADSNATQPLQNAQGTFTFTKSPAGFNETGLSNGGFSNVSIVYTPGASNPPPTGGGGGGGGGADAGIDESDERADTITGGCSATGDGIGVGALFLVLAGASFVATRRRSNTRR
jgi:hypothetical protein